MSARCGTRRGASASPVTCESLHGACDMHAALPVGAARVKFCRPSGVQQTLLPQQCCQHPTCQAVQPQPPIETLTHVFLECSMARRAWQWWRGMWLRLDPAAGLMPLDPRLLAHGEGAWALSGQQCALLWDHLRVLIYAALVVGDQVLRGRLPLSQCSSGGGEVCGCRQASGGHGEAACQQRYPVGDRSALLLVKGQGSSHPTGRFQGQVVPAGRHCLQSVSAAFSKPPLWGVRLLPVSTQLEFRWRQQGGCGLIGC
jgi:hypothetical protein